ncbi:MAG TPA: hypothetical protein PLI90_08370 [Rhodocyclaceae bacterium]|nr:hypothetical protein [Rhodocyclaceae bacterium]
MMPILCNKPFIFLHGMQQCNGNLLHHDLEAAATALCLFVLCPFGMIFWQAWAGVPSSLIICQFN